MRRLLDTQRMLVQFSRENDRLANENGRLRTGKALVGNDYAGEGSCRGAHKLALPIAGAGWRLAAGRA